jgi:hypothetical protein
LTTVVVTLLRPDSFASSAKILHAANNPLPFAVSVAKMMSRPSLDQVITNLNLRAEWGRKYKQPGDLSAEKCREMLDRMIAIEVPRNAPLVEIKVRSDNPSRRNPTRILFVPTSDGTLWLDFSLARLC